MQLVITRPDGDLKHEVWWFTLNIGWVGSPCIFFEGYSFETRDSLRHRKWVKQTHWTRLDHSRNNNITEPPLPPDVENEVRTRYQESITNLAIVK